MTRSELLDQGHVICSGPSDDMSIDRVWRITVSGHRLPDPLQITHLGFGHPGVHERVDRCLVARLAGGLIAGDELADAPEPQECEAKGNALIVRGQPEERLG